MSNEATRTMDKCIVYWDYENQPIPKADSLSTIVPILKNKLCSSIGKKLPIEFKVYVQASQITHELQNAFDINGMMQIHVPSTKPESVDKRMIFDITFSLYELERDNKSRPIAIISADKDFGHLLSNIHNTSPISHQFLILLHDNSIDPNLSNAVDGIIHLSHEHDLKKNHAENLKKKKKQKTVNTDKIQIRFEHLNSVHETFMLEIKTRQSNTVSNVREMVQQHNIRVNRFYLPKKALILLFNGNVLKDDTKIRYTGVSDNDTIIWYYDMNIIVGQNDDEKIKDNYSYKKKSNSITIHLQEQSTKEIITISVPTQIVIKAIKTRIKCHTKWCKRGAIKLRFKGKKLHNKRSIDIYGICDGDTIICEVKRKATWSKKECSDAKTICINLEQLGSGNTFNIKWKNNKKIVGLRQVVCNKNMHLKRSRDEFFLFHKNIELIDKNLISDYNICDGDTIIWFTDSKRIETIDLNDSNERHIEPKSIEMISVLEQSNCDDNFLDNIGGSNDSDVSLLIDDDFEQFALGHEKKSEITSNDAAMNDKNNGKQHLSMFCRFPDFLE